MANTYTQLNVHAVFSVKGRENLLNARIREDVFKYIAGILQNTGQFPLAVNGYKDHVHIMFELNPVQSIAEILTIVKSNSSKWINDQHFLRGKFYWQTGYGAFSYSRSQRNEVIRYIMGQEAHHRITTFRDEYLKLLEQFQMEYRERYLFEFYD